MKSKLIAVTLLFSVFLTSCDAVDDLLSFNISNSTSIKIPSTSPINLPSEIITPEVTTNSSAEFENNKTKANLVKDVKIRSLKLSISDPSDKTFTFLKSIHIYISTTDSDEIELAYMDNISATTNMIDLTCTDARLDKYIKADKYKIRTKVTLKETLTKDVTVKADMKFRVTADPF
jgi:LysM repeat protein